MSVISRLLFGSSGLYVGNVFSTDLYTGNGATQTISNGINLANRGGMVWVKPRGAGSHNVFDTERGALERIEVDSGGSESTLSNSLTAFSTTGFDLGSATEVNNSGSTYAAWSFREARNFFDVVTYTGTGVTRTVAHDLGTVPGMIVVKRLSGTSASWWVYHRATSGSPETAAVALNSNDAATSGYWGSTAPTSAEFTVSGADVNRNTDRFVAYLFAHDDSPTGLMQCGSYTGNGSASGPTITLGWQPQWLLVKNVDANADWRLFDAARGMTTGSNKSVAPDNDGSESSTDYVNATATGFEVISADSSVNGSGNTIIYAAIRAE